MTAVEAWFEGGGPVMPALLAVGVLLYAVLFDEALRLLLRARPSDRGGPSDADGRLLLVRALIGAAPLLGLLGTVSGLIDSFAALVEDATIQRVGVGIGHALRTTQYGMALAAPALLLERVLSRAEARAAT